MPSNRMRRSASLAVLLLLAGGLSVAAQQNAERAAVLRQVRQRMRQGDWPGALARLTSLRIEDGDAGDLATLEATCWLARALAADQRADELLSRVRLSGYLRKFALNPQPGTSNQAFLVDVRPQLDAYFTETGRLTAAWPDQLAEAVSHVEKARSAGQRALRLTAAAGTGRPDALGAAAWSELARYLVLRDAANAALVARQNELSLPALTRIEAMVPKEGEPLLDRQLREALLPLLKEAAGADRPELPLAAAEITALYATASGKLDRNREFRARRMRYTSFRRPDLLPGARPRPAAPQTVDEPLSADPKSELDEKSLATALEASPERLVLPLYRVAARLDPQGKLPEIRYGEYFQYLYRNEAAAARTVEEVRKRRPADPLWAAEQVRQAACREDDLPRALALLGRSGVWRSLERPVFGSVPEELRKTWYRTRHAQQYGPRLALTFAPLFQVLSLRAAEARKNKEPAHELHATRLRLAEVLLRSEWLPDVRSGAAEARSALEALEQEVPEGPEKQAVRLRKQALQQLRLPREPEATVSITRSGVGPTREEYEGPYMIVSEAGWSISSFGVPKLPVGVRR